ncbi:hypothetical protein F5I97DRAFT_1803163 [Phlebopus sp. FC_14]|nr:hypothetical protein F5I97DRAFT_1803163 [Phlebopus sp. FC_14]
MTKRRATNRATKAKSISESPSEVTSDAYQDSDGGEEDAESLHSDALDLESDHDVPAKSQKKRRRASTKSTSMAATSKTKSTAAKTSARKKRKVENEEPEEEDITLELKDGQEIVGKVVQAPKTGWVSEGQVSQHTLDFLAHMQDPACNDRVWWATVTASFVSRLTRASRFKLHDSEPVYRRCEKEFKHFIEAFTMMLIGVDPQIPQLPPRDVIHRIYRDIRFSNDKTPYKKGFSASFSRSGRKGIYAFCQPEIKSGNESMLAAGAWCPAKNELSTIRSHIRHSSRRIREIISGPEFVRHFGEPRPHPHGERQSIFGREDELKTAPKGIDKNHPDIDLLKCRSFAVSRTFTDEQVLGSTFIQDLGEVARILRPFVHCLNDMITLPVDEESEGDEQ